jgi:hypothetical protein
MMKSTIALAGEDRQITNFDKFAMASKDRGQDSYYWMETTDSSGDEFRSGADKINVWMFKDERADEFVPTSPHSDFNLTTTAWSYIVQAVDKEANLYLVSSEPSGHSHIAVPAFFSGRKEDFKCFWQQIGLFITTNEKDFTMEKSMILFSLSYMMEELVELWANAFVIEALEMGNWGL